MTKSLDEKQKEIDGLVASIELRNRTLTSEERLKTEAIQYGLKTRLDSLVDRCKHEEMDLKIGAMTEILAIIKTHE